MYTPRPKIMETRVCPTCGAEFETRTTSLKIYCRSKHSIPYKERKRLSKRKSSRIPKWQSMAELDRFYKNKPEGYQIDHIIPLKHPDVCGLHCVSNLQYLTPEENAVKSNKWDGSYDNASWKKLL